MSAVSACPSIDSAGSERSTLAHFIYQQSIFTRTTGTSALYGRTFRSSKNLRKQKRKKLRLKEGRPFEDVAIINGLHVLFSSMASVLRKFVVLFYFV
jgi:hypothetical protein